jgi:hypothetical protein
VVVSTVFSGGKSVAIVKEAVAAVVAATAKKAVETVKATEEVVAKMVAMATAVAEAAEGAVAKTTVDKAMAKTVIEEAAAVEVAEEATTKEVADEAMAMETAEEATAKAVVYEAAAVVYEAAAVVGPDDFGGGGPHAVERDARGLLTRHQTQKWQIRGLPPRQGQVAPAPSPQALSRFSVPSQSSPTFPNPCSYAVGCRTQM